MMKRIKNIALFFAAPFIGLAYIIALLVYGMYMLTKTGIEAYRNGNV